MPRSRRSYRATNIITPSAAWESCSSALRDLMRVRMSAPYPALLRSSAGGQDHLAYRGEGAVVSTMPSRSKLPTLVAWCAHQGTVGLRRDVGASLICISIRLSRAHSPSHAILAARRLSSVTRSCPWFSPCAGHPRRSARWSNCYLHGCPCGYAGNPTRPCTRQHGAGQVGYDAAFRTDL
jgi:hypothetical protein